MGKLETRNSNDESNSKFKNRIGVHSGDGDFGSSRHFPPWRRNRTTMPRVPRMSHRPSTHRATAVQSIVCDRGCQLRIASSLSMAHCAMEGSPIDNRNTPTTITSTCNNSVTVILQMNSDQPPARSEVIRNAIAGALRQQYQAIESHIIPGSPQANITATNSMKCRLNIGLVARSAHIPINAVMLVYSPQLSIHSAKMRHHITASIEGMLLGAYSSTSDLFAMSVLSAWS